MRDAFPAGGAVYVLVFANSATAAASRFVARVGHGILRE